uniref:Eukaryotic translation initiation factor 4E binding protein 1 n=1 Tax=Ursus maritimus TaxID=29073 RepID=A0A452TVB4_URSMA
MRAPEPGLHTAPLVSSFWRRQPGTPFQTDTHASRLITCRGTRIIYDRKFLMECRNSPVTKTPPRDLPTIPGVTSPASEEPPTEPSQNHLRHSPEDKPAGGEESQFEMDI